MEMNFERESGKSVLTARLMMMMIIHLVICRLPLFIISMAHFPMQNSTQVSWLFSLSVLGFSVPSPFCQKNWCCLWVIFFCNLWSLYLPVKFLSMWLSDIINITNSSGDRASPWNIPLRIITSVKLFPSNFSLALQFCMVYSINYMTSPDILYILRESIIHLCRTISYAFS